MWEKKMGKNNNQKTRVSIKETIWIDENPPKKSQTNNQHCDVFYVAVKTIFFFWWGGKTTSGPPTARRLFLRNIIYK